MPTRKPKWPALRRLGSTPAEGGFGLRTAASMAERAGRGLPAAPAPSCTAAGCGCSDTGSGDLWSEPCGRG